MPNKKILYLGSDPSRFRSDDVDVVRLQLFDIVPRPWNLPTIASAFADWSMYTCIIFTSKHAVATMHEVLSHYECSLPIEAKVIAVGRTTAQALEQKGWHNLLVAKEERQEGVIEVLRTLDWDDGSYVLVPRSSKARGAIEQFLVERRIRHQICDLYDTKTRYVDPFPNLEEFDEILFSSPSTVSAFFSQICEIPKRPVLRAIGEVTWQNLARATMICTTLSAK